MKIVNSLLLASAMGLCIAPAYAVLDAQKVKNSTEALFPAYLVDHKTVTEIESPTGDRDGSLKMADWLKKGFEDLGYSVEFRQNDRGTHVIAKINGQGKLRILFLGHTDTVQPVGSLQKQPYDYDEKTGIAKGPGVGDSKASVAMLYNLAKLIDELKYNDFGSLTFYFSAEEETGSDFETALLEELAKVNDVTFSVDSAPEGWGITTQRKWVINYELNIKGQTGHSGNIPQASSSATVELANQITRIMALASPLPENPQDYTPNALKAKGIQDRGQFLPDVSINIGVIKTDNTKVNAVPDNAYVKLEVRGFKAADLKRIENEINKIAASPTVAGTSVTVTSSNFMPAMEKTPQVQKLVDVYTKIIKDQFNADIVEWSAGGVTIGNLTSHYIPTFDGLGVEVARSHDLENERAFLNTFVPRTASLLLMIDEMIDKNLIEQK